MNLNLAKIRRKVKYFINASQYIIMFFIVSIINLFAGKIVTYTVNNNYCSEVDFLCLGETTEKFSLSCRNEKKSYIKAPDIVFYANFKTTDKLDCNNKVTFYNIAQHECSIVKANGINIGCIILNLDKKRSLLYWKLLISKKRQLLRKNSADFLIAYVKGSSGNNNQIGQLKKLIGTWGFDCVIGIGGNIKGRKNFRTIVFNETRILYSLGNFNFNKNRRNVGEDRVQEKIGVGYRATVHKEKKKFFIIREGYIPLLLTKQGDNIININELTKEISMSSKHGKKFLQVERIMKGLRNWGDLILMKDIFSALDITIPKRYRHLENASINQICARTFELEPGNIFFLRQAFNDKNDIKKESEFVRNKLIVRAVTRKSLFIFSYKKLPSIIPHIVIKNPMEAHIKVMGWYRDNFIKAQFIGVTGSVGKTSTKDMLYYVLNEAFITDRNIRNSNVQVKIGINEQRIPSDTELYVQEIGGGRPGGASRHSRMINPKITVITNIGTAHIGNYESQEELRDHKLGIIDGMQKNGVAFLNGDDPLLNAVSPNCNVIYYAVDNKKADYYAESIRELNGITSFDIVSKTSRTSVCIPVLGKYNVLNAVCAFAVAEYFGMTAQEIINGLMKFRTAGIRQNIIKTGGYILFADCYNASVSSVNSSLSILTKLIPKKNCKKIAIIGDITGMGDREEEINVQIAEILNTYTFDHLICYGNNSKYIYSRLNHKNEAIYIEDRDDLEAWMSNNIKRGDITLLKGSSKMEFDEIMDSVFGLNLSDQRYIDEVQCSTLRKRDLRFKIFKNYASLYKYTGKKDVIKVGNTLAGKKIKKIVKKAFYNNKSIKKVYIGKNVLHVGSFAFANCTNLEEVVFEGDVKFIGEKAFENCVNLKKINFGNGLMIVGNNAFYNCNSLKEIRIPRAIEYVNKRTFKGINVKYLE